MIDVYYENSRGEKICLTNEPYYFDMTAIADGEWSYTTADKRKGSYIAAFYKELTESSHQLVIKADTQARLNQYRDRLNNITEYDVLANTPGTIRIDGWYTKGYIIGSEKTIWQADMGTMVAKLKFVVEEPFWWKDTSTSFFHQDSGDVSTEGAKDYEFDYTYDYLSDNYANGILLNPAHFPSNFVLIINGYAYYPTVNIGDISISINVTVEEGEYLTIDSREKTVTLTEADGSKTNCFGLRDLDGGYIFAPVPAGDNQISWNGNYSFTIKLIEERSEPRWTT